MKIKHFMCMCVLPEKKGLFTNCPPGAQRCQNLAKIPGCKMNPLKLKLPVVVSHYLGAGNQTYIF